MRDDELEELLRRTLRHRAERLRPSASARPEPGAGGVGSLDKRRRRPLVFATAGAAAAAIALAVALSIVLPGHRASHTNVVMSSPPPTSPVGAGPATTLPAIRTTTPSVQNASPSTLPPLALGAAPTGFVPLSVTFVSSRTGWVLGSVPCGSGSCASLVHTTDGGAAWSEVPSPTGVSLPAPAASQENQPALVRFANLEDGWIVTPGPGSSSTLWTTHDGGYHWSQIAVPAGPQAMIEDIEASNDVVDMVVAVQGGFAIYETPAAGDGWVRAGTLPYGGGPVPSAGLTLQGTAGWILDLDRTVISGARLSAGGAWVPWSPPVCSGAEGGGILSASSATGLVAICDEGMWGPPSTPGITGPYPAEWLFRSTDGGSTFTVVGRVPTSGSTAAQPTGVATTVVVGNSAGLVGSFDGGKTWQSVYSGGAAAFVGFTSASQGVALVGGSMIMTTDGGHTWHGVAFR